MLGKTLEIPLVEYLKNYFALVGGSALVLGLIVSSPSCSGPVRLEAYNPLVLVDLQKLEASIKGKNVSSVSSEQIYKALEISVVQSPEDSSRRFACFPLEWYYSTIEEGREPDVGSINSLRRKLDEDWATDVRLRTLKKKLGYEDADLRSPVLGEQFYSGENQLTVRELVLSPHAIWQHIWGIDAGSMPSQSMSIVSYPRNPLYSLFESVSDRSEKAHLYESLCEASTFYSLFTVSNKAFIVCGEVSILARIPKGTDARFVQGLRTSNVIIKEQFGDYYSLIVRGLRFGKLSYASIVVKTETEPLAKGSVYLEDEGVVVNVAQYWVWLLVAPAVLLKVCVLFGGSERKAGEINRC